LAPDHGSPSPARPHAPLSARPESGNRVVVATEERARALSEWPGHEVLDAGGPKPPHLPRPCLWSRYPPSTRRQTGIVPDSGEWILGTGWRQPDGVLVTMSNLGDDEMRVVSSPGIDHESRSMHHGKWDLLLVQPPEKSQVDAEKRHCSRRGFAGAGGAGSGGSATLHDRWRSSDHAGRSQLRWDANCSTNDLSAASPRPLGSEKASGVGRSLVSASHTRRLMVAGSGLQPLFACSREPGWKVRT
jgi:hypothetical protein